MYVDQYGNAHFDATTQEEYDASIAAGTAGASPAPVAPATSPLNIGTTAPYQRPAGIPEYAGYQAPNYNATTPNSKHWLNTMNAFSPNARTDMERMLGFSAPAGSGGGGVQYPISSPNESPWGGGVQSPITRPPVTHIGGTTGDTGLLGSPTVNNYVPPDLQHQGFTPGLMDAFYPNTGTSQYTAPYTAPTTSPTTSTYKTGLPTVGIDPATGSLTFL